MDFSFKVPDESYARHLRIYLNRKRLVSVKLIYTQEITEIIAVFSMIGTITPRTLKGYMNHFPSQGQLMKKSLLIHREITFTSLPEQFKEQGKIFTLHTPDSAGQSIEEQQQMLQWQGYMTMVVTIQADTINPTQRVYKWK